MVEPIILSTWSFGSIANAAGWPVLASGGASIDAVEVACRAVEADVSVNSVGRGGTPDRSGRVSLDGSIMLSPSRCGSVCFVRRFMHPVSLARRVMEETEHVLLAGEGAEQFAERCGFEPAELLTDEARQRYTQWLADHGRDAAAYLPAANIEEQLEHNRDHDTVGVLALDAKGVLAGACSTSGLAFKLPGRVGDSPIIGHGLYVHPDHGAAVATGNGELMMGVCATHLAVELMRRGSTPLDAGCEVLQRIIDSYRLKPDHQSAMILLRPDGQWASVALRAGYTTNVRTARRDERVGADRVVLA